MIFDKDKSKEKLNQALNETGRRTKLEVMASGPSRLDQTRSPSIGQDRAPIDKVAVFKGREVSCRAVALFFDEIEKKELPPETLTAGVDYPLSYLLDKHERIDWASYRTILGNAGKIWSEDALVDIGKCWAHSVWARPFSLIGKLLFSADDIYRQTEDLTIKPLQLDQLQAGKVIVVERRLKHKEGLSFWLKSATKCYLTVICKASFVILSGAKSLRSSSCKHRRWRRLVVWPAA